MRRPRARREQRHPAVVLAILRPFRDPAIDKFGVPRSRGPESDYGSVLTIDICAMQIFTKTEGRASFVLNRLGNSSLASARRKSLRVFAIFAATSSGVDFGWPQETQNDAKRVAAWRAACHRDAA